LFQALFVSKLFIYNFQLSEKEKALQEERRLLKEKAKLEKEERDRIKAQVI